MNKKHDIEVMIQSKRYTLCGYESEEYLQKIASYINGKYAEYKDMDGYKQLDTEMKNILLQINVADDYVKASEQVKELKALNDSKSEELFDIKHEAIVTQTELDKAKKEIERLTKELEETRKALNRPYSKSKR